MREADRNGQDGQERRTGCEKYKRTIKGEDRAEERRRDGQERRTVYGKCKGITDSEDEKERRTGKTESRDGRDVEMEPPTPWGAYGRV